MPGLQDLRVTLYDIFGYLLPGLIAFVAVCCFVWALFLPRHALHEPKLTTAAWFALLTSSYVLGHLIQAVSNLLPFLQLGERNVLTELPPDLISDLHRRSRTKPGDDLYHICDTVVSQSGTTQDREVYQYREGFYRGLTVALALTLVALIVRAARSGASLASGGRVHVLSAEEFAFAAILVGLAMYLSYHRHQRFAAYKLRNAFIGFLAVADELPTPKTEPEAPAHELDIKLH